MSTQTAAVVMDEHAKWLRVYLHDDPEPSVVHGRGRFGLTDSGEAFYFIAERGVDSQRAVPTLAAHARGLVRQLDRETRRKGFIVFAAPGGQKWELDLGGCGCNSPLKRFGLREAVRKLLETGE